ncbi:MAG: porin family protein [Gemmatimonadales bacterium]|jgi:hypothetical protein|nr:MAG: porin family protein [Gemmatimonadales bacterium]
MKRFVCLTVCALALTAAPAFSQSIFVGVGPTFPTGDYSEYANTGFMLVGGLTFEIANNLDIYGEVGWGQNNHEQEGDKTNPVTFMGGLVYGFGGAASPVEPYVFGGAGILQHRYSSDEFGDESDSGFGFQGGAGVGFDLAGLGAWVEGRFTSASIDYDGVSETTAYFALVAGVSIDLSGGD